MFEEIRYISCGKFVSNGEWIHPKRVIDSFEIIFVVKGNVYINENDTEYTLGQNDILILEPDVNHFGYKESSNTEFFWLHFSGKLDISPNEKLRKTENPYAISLYFRQLLKDRTSQKLPEGMDYLTRLILIELYSNSTKPDVSHVAESVAAWIKANCHTAITEMQVASHFGYNVDYLNRMFKTYFFKTIKQHINDKKMEYIKNLMLCNDLALKEIATRSGFSEYKYFLKFFKYHEKITPTEFYNQYAKIHINTQ